MVLLIAVISDSHNHRRSVNAVKGYIQKADIIIFLGDGEEDIAEITKDFTGEFYAIKGNCDIKGVYPDEMIIELASKKIFICHGHKYGVKMSYNGLYYKAKEVGADIALFGHTHVAMIEEYNDVILMNPGSIFMGYGQYRKSLGYIEILDNGHIETWIKELKV